MKQIKDLRKESWHILRDSVPNFILYLSFYISATINLSYLSRAHYVDEHGNKDESVLAGCGLGTSIMILCIYSLLCSINIAIINIGSTALGKGLPRLAGYTLHRAVIIDVLMLVPITAIIWYAEPILMALGTDGGVAKYTALYAFRLIPAMAMSVMFNALHYFLANYKVFYPQIAISTASLVLHYFWCGAFSSLLGDTFTGVIWAKTLTEFLTLSLTVVYVCYNKEVEKSWFMPDRKSTEQVVSQLKHGFEAGALGYFEEVSEEIIILMAGGLPVVQIVAMVGCVNFCSLNLVIAIGIGLTTNTYMAEQMGRQCKRGAIAYMKAAVLVTSSVAILDMLIAATFKDFFMSMYSQDPIILAEMSGVYTLYNLLIPFDFAAQMLSGVLRAVGREDIGAKIFFGFYYVVAIPVSYYFGIHSRGGAFGLWSGIAVAIIGVCFGCGAAVYKVDWDKQLRQVSNTINTLESNCGQELKEIESPVLIQKC